MRAIYWRAQRYMPGSCTLKAGHKPARGQKGAAHAYNISSYREQERRWVEQAEAAYTRFVAGWNPRGPKPATKARTGAANEERR
jgi:transposase